MIHSEYINRVILWIPVLISVFIITGCKHEPADLILFNAKIITLEEAEPQAEALAVTGDRITAVGSNSDIQNYIGESTQTIDLGSKLVIPGFIESHAHFMGFGYSKMKLELGKTRNWDEVIDMVAEAVTKVSPGEWIQGRGWHQEKWDRIPDPVYEGYPVHNKLSGISPDNPVLLTHASGHAIIVNETAMQLAGITENSEDPEGGRIIRDDQDYPTGVFLETAEDLIYSVLEEMQAKRTLEQIELADRKAFELAVKTCLANGITSFHDAGAPFDRIEFYKRMLEEQKMGIRLWVMIGDDNEKLKQHIAEYPLINPGDHRLTVRAIKKYMDGALGSRGAWLLQPYTDLPTSSGLNTDPLEDIRETAELSLKYGLQLCTHAIGDRANRETLNIYEEVMRKNDSANGLRWRIEHAQHISASDIPRFSRLGVIAAMQPNHCTSDGPWVPKRIGYSRAEEGAYVWQKLIKSGAIICCGTDAPVEDINPILNFYSAVTRKLRDNTQFFPDQCMTREQALRGYTLNGAYAAFEENIKGSLKPGKLADMVILSRDILTIPEDEIADTVVEYTIVGGKIVYDNPL